MFWYAPSLFASLRLLSGRHFRNKHNLYLNHSLLERTVSQSKNRKSFCVVRLPTRSYLDLTAGSYSQLSTLYRGGRSYGIYECSWCSGMESEAILVVKTKETTENHGYPRASVRPAQLGYQWITTRRIDSSEPTTKEKLKVHYCS